MRYKTAINALIGATVLYGLGLPMVKVWWPESFTLLMWISPALFYLYEAVYSIVLSRQERMTPQKAMVCSMILRGVKFLGVAVMMLVWVAAELPGKNVFLLYTLGYYLLTSLFEGLAMKAHAKEVSNKQQR